RAIGHLRLRERVDVTRDRILRIDSVAFLHALVAHVELIFRGSEVAGVLLAVRIALDALAERIARVAGLRETARRAVRAAGIRGAHGGAARRGRRLAVGAEDLRAREL